MRKENKYGLALPEVPYPVFKETLVTANKYGEINIDGIAVHVPTSYHYNKLQLITYWNEYKVISPNAELLSKGPRPYYEPGKRDPLAFYLY